MTLSALLIILFFLPGFIFNLAYYNSETIPLNISLTHKAIASLFITLILHTASLTFLIYFLDEKINLNFFLMLLSELNAEKLSVINLVTNYTIELAVIYLICVYAIAFMLGIFFRWSIKKYKLDQYSFLKIDNHWYYLFTGCNGKVKPDGVKIAAILEIGGYSYLYQENLSKEYTIMANNSSNNVAIVAIILILVFAILSFYYFVQRGGFKTDVETTSVQVNLPKSDDKS